jgi:hypothetical protein
MAQHAQFAHHPPSAPDREHDPERQRRRGAKAGAAADRGAEKAAEDQERSMGIAGLKTIAIGGGKRR